MAEAWEIIVANLVVAPVNASRADIEWAAMLGRLALLPRLSEVARSMLLLYNSRCGMLVARTRAYKLHRLFRAHWHQSMSLNSAWTIVSVAMLNADEEHASAAAGDIARVATAIERHGESLLERVAGDAGMASEGNREWERQFSELTAQLQPVVAGLSTAVPAAAQAASAVP
jgi:hypothetical protein